MRTKFTLPKVLILLCTLATLSPNAGFSQVRPVSLAGRWLYRLDSLDRGIPEKWYSQSFKDGISLPGTLDDASIGRPVKADSSLIKPVMLHLSRKRTYIGAAWYQRTFSTSAAMTDALLSLERVLWRSDCWIDGKPVGEQESLIAPHIFY